MTIGLSLSGGGARGIAHVGVLQALNEVGIFPTHIAGVSAGAIVGSLYAQGIAPMEIITLIRQAKWNSLLRPAGWGKFGLLNLDKMGDMLLQHIPHNSFEGLKLPVTVSATNIQRGSEVIFNEGELIKPLLASSCVPFLFSPVSFQGLTLVDGGVLNGLLYDPIAHCDFTIGVYTNSFDPAKPVKGLRTLMRRCFNLVLHNSSRQNLSKFDFALEPTELGYCSPTNMYKAAEVYAIGYQAMKTAMPALLEKLSTI